VTHNENTPLLIFVKKRDGAHNGQTRTLLRVHLVSDARFNRYNGCDVALTRTGQSSPAIFA
jgi:hypothetical protein